MIHAIRIFLLSIVAFIVAYLIGSFVLGSINLFTATQDFRFGCTILWIVLSIVFSFSYAFVHDNSYY